MTEKDYLNVKFHELLNKRVAKISYSAFYLAFGTAMILFGTTFTYPPYKYIFICLGVFLVIGIFFMITHQLSKMDEDIEKIGEKIRKMK